MADKKITALTELNATGKAGEDFLHIIDYGGGSSPVNKRISLTNLFNNANLDTHIYGTSKTFELGFTSTSISAFKVVTSASASGVGTVTINEDQTDYVDLLVKTTNSASAISVDASADTVTINGDSANMDFIVNGDTTAKMLFVDASADVLGVGVAAPATAYMLDVGEVGSGATGKSANFSGGVTVGGDSTFSDDVAVGSATTGLFSMLSTQALATDGAGDNPSLDTVVTLVSTTSASGAGTLGDGTVIGQLKIISMVSIGSGGDDYELTITNFKNGSKITFAALTACATLVWQSGGWALASWSNVTIAA